MSRETVPVACYYQRQMNGWMTKRTIWKMSSWRLIEVRLCQYCHPQQPRLMEAAAAAAVVALAAEDVYEVHAGLYDAASTSRSWHDITHIYNKL